MAKQRIDTRTSLEKARELMGDNVALVPLLGTADAISRVAMGLLDRDYDAAGSALADVVPTGRIASQAIKRVTKGLSDGDVGAIRNIIAGGGAKTIDKKARDKAERMERKGKSQQEIYRETGFFRSPNAGLSYEIPDANSRIIPGNGLTQDGTTPLSNILDHSALFEAYPHLKNLGVQIDNKPGSDGTFYVREGRIGVSPSVAADPNSLRSTLLHEAQHGVQIRDNKPMGYSPFVSTADTRRRLENLIDANEVSASAYSDAKARRDQLYSAKYVKELEQKASKESIKPSSIRRMGLWYALDGEARSRIGSQPSKPGPERDAWARRALDEMAALERRNAGSYTQFPVADIDQKLKSAQQEVRQYQMPALSTERNQRALNSYRSGQEFYKTNAGEAEARAVEARRDMPVSEARKRLPLEDYDVPLSDVWGIQGGLTGAGADSSLLNRLTTAADKRMADAQRNAAKPASEGGLGLPPDNTAADRAEAMGFKPVIHGTSANDIEQVNTQGRRYVEPFYVTENSDPRAAEFAGQFALTKPERGAPTSYPLMIDLSKVADTRNGVPDALMRASESAYAPLSIGEKGLPGWGQANNWATHAKRNGLKAVMLDERSDLNSIAVLDPAILRSRFAAFDPARRDEADLMALIGGIKDSGLLNINPLIGLLADDY